MSARVRVYALDVRAFSALVKGEARWRNLPLDACIEAFSPSADGRRIGVRVSSQRFEPVAFGCQLPLVAACLEYPAATEVAA